MKNIIVLVTLSIIFISSCKKGVNSSVGSNKNSLVDSAVQFLKSKLSSDDFSKLDFESVRPLEYRNQNIAIQFYEKDSHDKFLLIRKDLNKYTGNWVDISDLRQKQSIYETWSLKLASLDRNLSKTLEIKNNKLPNNSNFYQNDANSIIGVSIHKSLSDKKKKGISLDQTEIYELPEVIVIAYVEGESTDLYNLTSFLVDVLPDDLYYANESLPIQNHAAGAQANKVIALPKFNSPETPIKDIKNELKCFTVNAQSTYSISVNVNQPWPNSRDKVDPTAVYVVGHTFLTLRQTNSDGSEIIRNVGFYPKNYSKPGSSVDQSVFGDDTYTGYNVSLKMTVSGSELNSVINTLVDQQSKNFDLNNFNCTNSAMDALKSINVNLPSTKSGDEILFNGNNPSDLGQDIRGLNLNDFSQNNGNRNVARTASNSNDQKPDAKKGSC